MVDFVVIRTFTFQPTLYGTKSLNVISLPLEEDFDSSLSSSLLIGTYKSISSPPISSSGFRIESMLIIFLLPI